MSFFIDDTIIKNISDDIGFEDITTKSLIPENKWVKAEIISKQKGILSGMTVANHIMNMFNLEVISSCNNGDKIHENEIILEFEGKARDILIAERSILNYLMHLSGISTTVYNTVEKVNEINSNIRVACTRKTTPGLQKLEKEAVQLGGGDTHRFRLDDCVLIKDNHIQIVGSVIDAIEIAKSKVSFTKKIEIEVENLDDAIKAAKFGADIIMLDNMKPTEIKKALTKLEEENLRDKVLIEVSGGITPSNIIDYAQLNIDIISSGFITNSTQSLDMSLEII